MPPNRRSSGDRDGKRDQLECCPVSEQLPASGYWNPDWDAVAELDPIWTEKFMAMGMHPVTAGVLEPKVIEFIAIAVDASCTHLYAPGTRRHIRKALELGATKEEIADVLQVVSVLGVHTMSLGAPSCSKNWPPSSRKAPLETVRRHN